MQQESNAIRNEPRVRTRKTHGDCQQSQGHAAAPVAVGGGVEVSLVSAICMLMWRRRSGWALSRESDAKKGLCSD